MSRAAYPHTKIVCTLGPSTDRPGMLRRLVEAGLDVARVNASHGRLEDHRHRIRQVRAVAKQLGVPVSILVDLPGPKHRLGKLRAPSITLRRGEEIYLGSGSSEDVLPLAEPALARELRVADPLYLADGTVRFEVIGFRRGLNGKEARCRVEVGGTLRSGSGLNLPGSKVTVRLPTAEDRKAIALAIEEKAEWIGVSFVRTAEDIHAVRQALPASANRPGLVAKIEKSDAMKNLEAIAEAAEAVMVARGDLGVETPLEAVPLAQKRIIAAALEAGKPVITATQMLESMVEQSSPTRAEVGDVANAILDGTDAVMLSAETAIGAHASEAVHALSSIIRATESQYPWGATLQRFATISWTHKADAISLAAARLSFDLKAVAIVLTGASITAAARIARFRPRSPIVLLSRKAFDLSQSSLGWGIRAELATTGSDTVAGLDRLIRSKGLGKSGDAVVVVSGSNRDDGRESDSVRVIRL